MKVRGQGSAVSGPSLRPTQTSWMIVQKLFLSSRKETPWGELPSSAPMTDLRPGDQPLTDVCVRLKGPIPLFGARMEGGWPDLLS